MAADMPLKVPPPVPVFSWTGCYIGGHVGGAWVSKEFNGAFVSRMPPSFVTAGTLVPISDSNTGINTQGGFLSGAQIGCNYQYAPNWVMGIEGDASWTSLSTSTRQNESAIFIETRDPLSIGAINAIANSTGTLSLRTNFIATVTGRLGYTW